ncbi:MAG: HEAT repeat domain-containing protein [Chloroflexi bacterium]|nr:HEAT repeat domain-containing protein [Chloroflexota bacterium]
MEQQLDLYEIVFALNSADRGAREQAFDELVGMGSSAVQPLVEMFPEIAGMARLEVIKAFGVIGDERAATVLADVVRSRDSEEVLFASSMSARALGQIGAVDTLADLLDENETGPRRMAVTVLKQMESDEAVEGLAKALEDDDTQVVSQAVEGLRSLGTPRAIAILDRHRFRR